MVQIKALKHLDTALQVIVTVGQVTSSVSCISLIHYEDTLGEESPILGKNKKRIQVINFPSSNLESVLCCIENSLKSHNRIKFVVNKSDLSRNPFLKYEKETTSDSNERDSTTKGCHFFLRNVRDEAYILSDVLDTTVNYLSPNHNFYPYIFVIFNKKTIFLKVNSQESYEYLEEKDIDVIFSEEAKPSIHLDISNETITLENLFILRSKSVDKNQELSLEDRALNSEKGKIDAAFSFIKMICFNIGEICTLHAKLYNINQIVFEDNLSGHIFIKQLITDSVKTCSDSIKVIFLRHEKFLHGIGDLILNSSTGVFQNSWTENYSESSGMVAQNCAFHGMETAQLTLDSLDTFLTCCPILSRAIEYFPDTQNLSENSSAREYWVNCIAEGVCQSMERMATNAKKEAVKNIEMYKDSVLTRLEYLRINHQAYGNLSMRVLQDTMENMKREMGLVTMYEKRKMNENVTALKELGDRLKYLDSLSFVEFHKELIKSLLAGNMFDWGAKEVAKLMSSGKLNFHQAMDKLPERPWLVDNFDEWLKRIQDYRYKTIMVFVDNSGYDLIIGVLPFAREFILRGAKVVICVNSEPVINDVTIYELKDLLEDIKQVCPLLKKAIEGKTLAFMEMTKSSCCLDLSFIDVEIARMMETIDLLVIEGMGRAVHTNLYAKFKCDTLRIAVIKDHWLSKQLGGDKFACICKFTYGAYN